jgi:hypothetical protein
MPLMPWDKISWKFMLLVLISVLILMILIKLIASWL